MRLAPHVKEFYLGFVGDAYPDLLPRYKRAYPGAYAPAEYRAKLHQRIERIRAQYGFSGAAERRGAPEPPYTRTEGTGPPARRGQQLALPLIQAT